MLWVLDPENLFAIESCGDGGGVVFGRLGPAGGRRGFASYSDMR